MRMLLDTNRYRDYAAGDPEVLERMRGCTRVFLSHITLAELRAGFLCGTKAAANERNLSLFLCKDSVETLYAGEQTTHHYARLFRQLRLQGTPIPTNDIWIAALVVQHDLPLYSRDAHFDNLPQLPRVA